MESAQLNENKHIQPQTKCRMSQISNISRGEMYAFDAVFNLPKSKLLQNILQPLSNVVSTTLLPNVAYFGNVSIIIFSNIFYLILYFFVCFSILFRRH